MMMVLSLLPRFSLCRHPIRVSFSLINQYFYLLCSTEPVTTSTTKKSPGALLKDLSAKAPKIDIDTEKIKTWVTDFANSKEAEEAMENLKAFAGKAGKAGLELAKNLGAKAGETLKEMKDAKDAKSTSTPPPTSFVVEEQEEDDFLSP